MTHFLCVAMALAVSPTSASDSIGFSSESATQRSASSPRTYAEWRVVVGNALRDEAMAVGENRVPRLKSLFHLALAVQTDSALSDWQRTQLRTRLQRRATKSLRRVERDIVLGQQLDLVNPAGVRRAARQPAANLDAVIPQVIVPEMWEPLGGPGNLVLFQRRAGGAGGNDGVRNGEGLVELIQTVIEPESWERVGGPGVIALFGQ